MAYIDDDEFIANIMTKEATESRKNVYACSRSLGSSKRRPNTRFLQNIVRDVKSHNSALFTKEVSEEHLRQKYLRHGNYALANAQDEQWHQTLPTNRQRKHDFRITNKNDPPNCSPDRDYRQNSYRRLSRTRQHQALETNRNHRGRRTDYYKGTAWNGNRKTNRHLSKQRIELSIPENPRPENSRRPLIASQKSAPPNITQKDPRIDFIGPPPPPQIRGRGSANAGSEMDCHFLQTYDPKLDVNPYHAGDLGWNDSLEAYRNRQKWKLHGAERLQTQGYDERFISAWQKGTVDEDDLKWTVEGGTREWDKGKTLEMPPGR